MVNGVGHFGGAYVVSGVTVMRYGGCGLDHAVGPSINLVPPPVGVRLGK